MVLALGSSQRHKIEIRAKIERHRTRLEDAREAAEFDLRSNAPLSYYLLPDGVSRRKGPLATEGAGLRWAGRHLRRDETVRPDSLEALPHLAG